MEQTEVYDNVVSVVAKHLSKDIQDIKPDSRFVEDLSADSLDIVEIIMRLEEEFSCTIPDQDAAKIVTINDAVQYIQLVLNKADKKA